MITTEYWATGQRATLTHGEASTRFYWDEATLTNDTHTPNTAFTPETVAYLIGAARHTRTISGEDTLYYVHDRHGNVTDLSSLSGQPRTRYTYSDYGTTTTHNPGELPAIDGEPLVRVGESSYQPFQYAGEYTAPTGTQWLQVRLYDPHTMRFTTLDNAQLHNKYAYADINPIMNTDPTGRTALPDELGFGLAIAGLVLAIAGFIATAVFSGGLSLGTLGALGATGLDAVITGLEVTDEYFVNIMGDTAAIVLGAVGLGVGLATAFYGGATRWATKRGVTTGPIAASGTETQPLIKPKLGASRRDSNAADLKASTLHTERIRVEEETHLSKQLTNLAHDTQAYKYLILISEQGLQTGKIAESLKKQLWSPSPFKAVAKGGLAEWFWQKIGIPHELTRHIEHLAGYGQLNLKLASRIQQPIKTIVTKADPTEAIKDANRRSRNFGYHRTAYETFEQADNEITAALGPQTQF